MNFLLIFLMLIAFASPVEAGELYGFYGRTMLNGSSLESFAYQLVYREGLGENLAVSASYLNEGHFPDHHRDGLAPLMLWGRTNLLGRRLSLAAGAGPYFYADTISAQDGNKDSHNVGALLGISATWYLPNRLLLQCRTNWILAGHSHDTFSTLVGVGYQLDEPREPGPLARPPAHPEMTTRNELTLFLGQTVVNNPGTPKSLAWSLEYRRGLLPYLDISAAWMDEGNNRLIRRKGAITELWLVRDFLEKHLVLGAGGGAYMVFENDVKGGSDFASAIISLTASARNFEIAPRLRARFTMNRIITNYDKDTDTFMVGLGYDF